MVLIYITLQCETQGLFSTDILYVTKYTLGGSIESRVILIIARTSRITSELVKGHASLFRQITGRITALCCHTVSQTMHDIEPTQAVI